jgi:hypothetical protein
MASESILETVNNHWAVRVVDADDRAAAVRYAAVVMQRIAAGDRGRPAELPQFLVPLASAYALAGREWLDFEGIGSPAASMGERQDAVRRLHLETAAAQAFTLTASLPVDPPGEEHAAMLYRTLMLAALARVGRREGEFEGWLALHGQSVFPARPADAPWDGVVLQRVVELWTHLLRGSGPSGLRAAMELIASLREDRPVREPAYLDTLPIDEQPRHRLHLFSLFHLAEAGTDLLLYRLHGQPESIARQLYARLMLAREAAAGDPRLDATCDWLYEAARLVAASRSSQLELLAEGIR